MFYAMAEEKIDLRGYSFEHILQDIQTLNERATRGELDITAVSIHAFSHVCDQYALLPSGASMGDGYGPMFVSAGPQVWGESDDSIADWLRGKRIAVPGLMTSAYLAARLFLGREFSCVVVPFDQIFDVLKRGEAEVGLLIHEGQLTYGDQGLHLVHDLGEWWKRTRDGLPLPLGGNVIRRSLPDTVRDDLTEILHESIKYGLEHREAAVRHSMPLARGMGTDLADDFIGMYVNDLTLDYGERGRAAVLRFLGEAADADLIPRVEPGRVFS